MAALKEVALGVLEQEPLVPGLSAGAGVEEVLEGHGTLGRADHPDLLHLCPAHPVSKLCQQ